MKGYQISKASNGFIVQLIDQSSNVDYRINPWVFETFENLSKWLAARLEKDHAICGSCSGSGLIK